MANRYTVKFNEVLLLTSSTKKDAVAFMKSLNKKHSRILSVVKKIEDEGGQVFCTVYVDREEGDYLYPVTSKRI
jgi:hypothetical protein